MSTLSLVILFITIRFVDLVISYSASFFIPYLGFFPYKEIFNNTFLSAYVYSFANFDGIHYIRTATIGYSQYAQAFFPLYPLLIRYSAAFFNSPILSGLVISWTSFFIGMWFFNRYLVLLQYDKKRITWILLFLCVYPTAFFFGAVYNTSLFFCLIVAALVFYKEKKYVLAGIIGMFAAITRLEGVFLMIPFGLPFLLKKDYKFTPKTLFALCGPLAGILTFMAFLWSTTGDPLYFIHSQPAFGANRSSRIVLLPQVLYRYIKIFFTANHDFRYWISIFEFSIFMFVLCILLWQLKEHLFQKKQKNDAEELGLNLFSLSNLLLPTLTGTLSSIPRYSLMALSMFIVLSGIKNSFIKKSIALVFFILHIIMLMYFIQGYFVS